MAASTQWEVVSKSSKKSKKPVPKSNKMSKNQIKNFIENMPTVKELTPVKESPTIFEAFLQQEALIEVKKSKDTKATNANLENGSKKNGSKKKNSDKKKEEPKRMQNLDEALSNLKSDELESFMILVQERFPNTPLVWLKDLVTYLNLKLDAPLPDVLFSGKPVDYPLSKTPTDVYGVVLDVFEKCPDAVLQIYFEHIISNLVEDTIKGQSTNGYRLVIQILAFYKPALTLNNIQKFKDLRQQHQNRHPVCLSLLWSLGQAGIKDFGCGMKVWLGLMLPVLGIRAYSKYTIDYLDILFNLHSNIDLCENVLGIREFFPVMDMIFSHSANLQPQLHKQLLALYPKLKTVAFGPNPSQVLRNYFPSFLLRLVPEAPLLLKNELKTCLTMCLAVDKHCFSMWRQLYTKHLIQSSLLLQHLIDEWEIVRPSLSHQLLKEMLGTFRVTNEEMAASSKTQPDGYYDCVKSCNVLLGKLSISAMFPWRFMFTLLVVLIPGFLYYDVQSHGSFEASITGKVLNDSGALVLCDHALDRITVHSLQGFNWLMENIPIYCGKVAEVVGPYIQQFWNQLGLLSLYIVDQTADVRAYLNRKIPELLEWVNDSLPTVYMFIADTLWHTWVLVERYLVITWDYVKYSGLVVGMWLQENVFVLFWYFGAFGIVLFVLCRLMANLGKMIQTQRYENLTGVTDKLNIIENKLELFECFVKCTMKDFKEKTRKDLEELVECVKDIAAVKDGSNEQYLNNSLVRHIFSEVSDMVSQMEIKLTTLLRLGNQINAKTDMLTDIEVKTEVLHTTLEKMKTRLALLSNMELEMNDATNMIKKLVFDEKKLMAESREISLSHDKTLKNIDEKLGLLQENISSIQNWIKIQAESLDSQHKNEDANECSLNEDTTILTSEPLLKSELIKLPNGNQSCLRGKFSTENIHKWTMDTVDTLNEYTTAAYQWVGQQLSTMVTARK